MTNQDFSFDGKPRSFEELRWRVERYLDQRCRKGDTFLDIVQEFRRGEFPAEFSIGTTEETALREESRQTILAALTDWGRDIERSGDPLAGALCDALLEEELQR